MLLAHKRSRKNLKMHEESIRGGVMGVYITTPIGGGNVVPFYSGTLIYDNQSIGSSKRPPLYGQGRLAVPVKNFDHWVLPVKQDMGDDQSLWIQKALSFRIRFINGDRETKNEVGCLASEDIAPKPYLFRRINVEFYDTGMGQKFRDVIRYTFMHVRALYNISAIAELFFIYSPAFEFSKRTSYVVFFIAFSFITYIY